jgi:hypothetical protein
MAGYEASSSRRRRGVIAIAIGLRPSIAVGRTTNPKCLPGKTQGSPDE